MTHSYDTDHRPAPTDLVREYDGVQTPDLGEQFDGGIVIASCDGREEGDGDDFFIVLLIQRGGAPYCAGQYLHRDGSPIVRIGGNNIGEGVQAYMDVSGCVLLDNVEMWSLSPEEPREE